MMAGSGENTRLSSHQKVAGRGVNRQSMNDAYSIRESSVNSITACIAVIGRWLSGNKQGS